MLKWVYNPVTKTLWSECGRFEIRRLNSPDFELLDYMKQEMGSKKPTSQYRCKLLADEIIKEESRDGS